MNFITVKDNFAETVIERSRFIAYAFYINDDTDAAEKLAALRKKHYDATHVCYAYIADEQGNITRHSDDGEPQGTAGLPILEAVKGANLKKAMVAVVRYFGGIKLGTGGLVRAYSLSTKAALEKAERINFMLCDSFLVTTDFTTFSRCERAIRELCVKPLKPVYGENVQIECITCEDGFKDKLTTVTLGRCDVQYLKKSYEEI